MALSGYKTILITGASSGLGKAAAELLSKDGHKLILLARREDRLKDLKKSLPTEALIYKVDITDKAEVAKFYNELAKQLGNIDVLINSAGLALGQEPFPDISLKDWETMIDTNIKGLLYITEPAARMMLKQGYGQIINIGSVAAHLPYKGGNVYGATKAFVRQFSRNLRTDLLGSQIKVTNIEPGMAETEFSIVRFNNDADKAKKYYAGMRPLQAVDIADIIKWIINQPEHVNIDNIEVMPLDQTYGGIAVNRT